MSSGPISRWLVGQGVADARKDARAPVKIIFDTDMWSDVDDLFALAMVHALADRGEAELLAVTSSTDDVWTPILLGEINHFYGREDVPVGMVHNGVTGRDTLARFPRLACTPSFPEFLAGRTRPDGSAALPRSRGTKPEDAVRLIRRTLARQSAGSVVLCQVGFSTNLARLLESGPDEFSPLGGIDMVRDKVRFLSVMAGEIADLSGRPLAEPGPEFNLMLDVEAARTLFACWPTPVIASGVEIGASMKICGAGLAHWFDYLPDHFIIEAYRHVDHIYRPEGWATDRLHDHGTFDLTAVLFAVRPAHGYFGLSPGGRFTVTPAGALSFVEDASGMHRYLVIDDRQRARTLEAMLMLASQPPRKVAQE